MVDARAGVVVESRERVLEREPGALVVAREILDPLVSARRRIDLEPWEGRGVHYLVSEKAAFAGKRVAIVGGGDSALDWVINLQDTAERVHLIHRRDGFRAHEVTVKQVMDLADAGEVEVHIPYTVREVAGNGTLQRVHLEGPEPLDLDIDALLLQLGFSTKLGPLKDWGLEISKGAIVVAGVDRHPKAWRATSRIDGWRQAWPGTRGRSPWVGPAERGDRCLMRHWPTCGRPTRSSRA